MGEPLPEPWRSLPARGVLFLRHRLARYQTREIAAHYGIQEETVRWHLKAVVRALRERSALRIHGVADVLVLAAYDRVPAEGLGG